MTQAAQPESESHRLVRKMIALKMNVGHAFIGLNGKESLSVNGYVLTVEQLLEIERSTELTSWGISDYLARHRSRV